MCNSEKMVAICALESRMITKVYAHKLQQESYSNMKKTIHKNFGKVHGHTYISFGVRPFEYDLA